MDHFKKNIISIKNIKNCGARVQDSLYLRTFSLAIALTFLARDTREKTEEQPKRVGFSSK